MIFVDSNVFIHAVGRSHPLKKEAQNFFRLQSYQGFRIQRTQRTHFFNIFLKSFHGGDRRVS